MSVSVAVLHVYTHTTVTTLINQSIKGNQNFDYIW